MTKEEAFNLVKNICRSYKGTANDHEAIQRALVLIHNDMFTTVDVIQADESES